jgi:DNA repair photolyase
MKNASNPFDPNNDIIDIRPLSRVLAGESPKNRVERMLTTFVKKRSAIQIGGITDPAGVYEERFGITLKVLNLFKTKGDNYPIRISFKGLAFTKKKALDIFEGYTNIIALISLSVPESDLNSRIEIGAPSIKKRISLVRELSKLGPRVGLRLRPILPNISVDRYINVIEDFRAAGAEILTVEWLRVPRSFTKGARKRFDKLSRLLGIDIERYYKANSEPTNNAVLRLKPKVVFDYYSRIKDTARKIGMDFASCNKDFRCFGTDTPNCCGANLDDPFWNRMQNSYAVHIAKTNGTVSFLDIAEPDHPFWEIENNGNTAREQYRNINYGDSLRRIWNTPKHRFFPSNFFRELIPVGRDKSGDLTFRYSTELLRGGL